MSLRSLALIVIPSAAPVDVAGTDAQALASVEVGTLAAALAGADAQAIGSVEAGTVAATLTGADSQALGSVEAGTVAVAVSGTDAQAVGSAEVATVAASVAGADAQAIGSVEAGTVAATVAGSDAQAIGSAEVGTVSTPSAPPAFVARTGGGSGTNAASYATASITPTADALVLLSVLSSLGTAPPTIPTVTGCGLTWVQIDTCYFDQSGTSYRLTLFRAMGASPTAGALTIDFGGVTQAGCAWVVDEATATATGGTHGSAAIVQTAKSAEPDAGAGTSETATLGTAITAGNVAYATAGWEANEAGTPESGWTILSQGTHAGPSAAVLSMWRADATDQSATPTWTTSALAGAIIVEVAAGAVGGTPVAGTDSQALGSVEAGTVAVAAIGTDASSLMALEAATSAVAASGGDTQGIGSSEVGALTAAIVGADTQALGSAEVGTFPVTTAVTGADATALGSSETGTVTAAVFGSDVTAQWGYIFASESGDIIAHIGGADSQALAALEVGAVAAIRQIVGSDATTLAVGIVGTVLAGISGADSQAIGSGEVGADPLVYATITVVAVFDAPALPTAYDAPALVGAYDAGPLPTIYDADEKW